MIFDASGGVLWACTGARGLVLAVGNPCRTGSPIFFTNNPNKYLIPAYIPHPIPE